MKTIYFKLIRNTAVLILILALTPTFSQVTVNVNVLPPYSPFFRDYSGITNNQVLVTLISTKSAKVYLTGSITKDDNSISIKVREGYKPLIPINLTANIPQTFTGPALRYIYGGSTEKDLVLQGVSFNEIMYNQALPEGNYSICIQARNYESGAVISEACQIITVIYYEPPQIIYPLNLSTVEASNPQYILTSWTPASAGSPGVSYRLRIVKLIPGVTPVDALKNATQVVLDKSGIITTVFPLDISTGVKLDTGQSYAMQVTASSPKAYFKNNGQSEPVSFYYKKPETYSGGNLSLNFINPNEKINYVEASSEKNILVNWNWFDPAYNKDTLFINDTIYKKYGVKKYELTIVNSTKKVNVKAKKVSFTKYFTEVDNKLQSYLILSQKSADSLGMMDSCWYQASVKAYNSLSQVIASASSVDFQYRKLKDEEPSLQVPVSAALKYIFKDSIENLFNITNTPYEVVALKKANPGNSFLPSTTINGKKYVRIAKTTGFTDKYGAFQTNVSIPLKYLTRDSIYFKVQMPDKYYIDKNFPLISMFAVNKDTVLSFGQLVALTYGYSLKLYVNKAYTSYVIKDKKDGNLDISLEDSIFHPGEGGYHYVTSSGGMSYAVQNKKMAEGITIVLYRKNKKNYIPPIEGNITDYEHISGFTEVARGITQKENDSTTFVKFERLLASVFDGDEYYLIALNGDNYNNQKKTGTSSPVKVTGKQVKNVTNNASDYKNVAKTASPEYDKKKPEYNLDYSSYYINQNMSYSLNNPYLNFAFSEDGFVAQEMPLKVLLPKVLGIDDSLYRKITATYDIVSTKPPTSLVKGRLLYHWKSDKNNQLRPLANARFRIVTEYLVDGEPIGPITSWKHSGGKHSFSQLFFVPEGKSDYSEGMSLLDHNSTMAVGKTDEQGNFTIEVVNINKKGSLGKGHVVEKGSSWSDPSEKPGIDGLSIEELINPVINPDPGYDNFGYTGLLGLEKGGKESQSIQNAINGSGVSFNSFNNSYDVGFGSAGLKGGAKGVQTKGMPAPYEAVLSDGELVTFERVYRIIPENQYFYPTKETFVVQPFETKNVPEPLTSYVKEVIVKVQAMDFKNNNLSQMMVMVFRSPDDKTPDLPLGEGDGKYKLSELISPQYKTSGETYDKTDAKDMKTGSSVFTEKYELLWPPAKNKEDGSISFISLLAGFEDYYIQVCSDPLGQKTYQATFHSVDTYVDDLSNPEYYLGKKYPPPIEVSVKLKPLPSRAFIRLLDNASKNSIPGSKGGRVTVTGTENGWISVVSTYSAYVDKDGYVEFLANQEPLSKFTKSSGTTQVSFDASANGYKKASYLFWFLQVSTKFTFNAEGDQFFYNFLLEPSARMKGHIVNIDDKNKGGVPAYIKVDSGKVIETDAYGYFSELPVPGIAGTKVFIIPKDVGFFDSTYTVTSGDASTQLIDLNDFGVYRRKHRIKFIITDNDLKPISGAIVQLGDTVRKTNNFGMAFFNFENVSVNNYTFVLRGPEGQNYIPKTLNLKNVETRSYVAVTAKLETGSVVNGKVTLDGKPVKGAKVYIDVAQQQSFSGFMTGPSYTSTSGALTKDANLIHAYSDVSGNYSLKGIPVNNQKIYLHATLDTNYTVNGDLKPADIKNKVATTNLSLTSYKAMLVNNIYGFPLTVEKIIPINADSTEAKVTGVVHWSKAISNFSLDEVNQVMRVEDVVFKESIAGGKKVGVAQNSSVTISGISSLKFKYLNKYNVKLTSVSKDGLINWLFPEPLVILKENDMGVIKGKINIVDNSFNFPNTYLNFSSAKNNFFLAEIINGTQINTLLSAVTSAMTETETNKNHYITIDEFYNSILSITQKYSKSKKLYNLSNQKGESIDFKLIEFDAKSNPLKSYIDESGKIHMNVNLECSIPNAQPEVFSLVIEDMILDENKVYPASSVSPIKLALENWTLNIKNWSFSTEEGGIVSYEGLINTKVIDIPFKKFVLRHDLFLMDEFEMKKLSMAGGGITLSNINDGAAGLVYDSKTGTDMKPHWRFCISGNPAAELPKLNDLGDYKLKLNYIQILSNDESVFQMQQQSSPAIIRKNNLAKYYPESIYNGPDYISISGALNVGAPRLGDMQLALVFKNPSSMKLQNIEADLEGQGFVHFVSRDPGNNIPNITIDKNQITILGNVIEKPNKTFNEIRSTFYAIDGATPVYKVEMEKDFVTQLTSEGNASSGKGHSLKIAKGGMSVVGTDWSILTYEGEMSSNTPEKNTKPSYMNFAVMGDISANSSSLEVSNIKTPFGEMKMVFDFKNKRLIGKLKAENIPLGTSKITGTIETLFDPDGFYIAGGCKADVKLPNPYIDGVYNMGFMVGSYKITSDLWGVVNSYKNPAVVNDCYRTKTAKGELKGFYFTLDRVIIEKSIGFDFILASGYVQANALIGADVYANFVPGDFSVGMGGYAYAHVAAGLSAITGTSIDGELNAKALVEFKYEDAKFKANTSMDLGFKATISQSLVLTTISKDISINCHAAGGTQGFSFDLGSGPPVQVCN